MGRHGDYVAGFVKQRIQHIAGQSSGKGASLLEGLLCL